jgi:hypothetical protein
LADESGGKPRAVRTLRIGRTVIAFAERLDGVRLSTALNVRGGIVWQKA